MATKITFISDTHGYHRRAKIPPGDILIHGGDIMHGDEGQLTDFFDWLAEQPHTYKLFIAGNLDRPLESNPDHYRSLLPEDTFYLENEFLEIEGLRIWGSPVVPRFIGAFNRDRGAAIRTCWEKIPADLDILLTHTPPAGILDRTFDGREVGCADLRERVMASSPKLHLFGHVHEAFGIFRTKKTTFVNGSFIRGHYAHYGKFNEAVALEI